MVVLEADAPAAGASGAAAGLVNPFMGRKAKAAWRHNEALEALAELAGEADAGLFRQTGVLRPATTGAQARVFAERAQAHDDLAWHSAAASAERWPQVASPLGTMHVTRGGSVDLGAFIEAASTTVEQRGGQIERGRLVRWEVGSSTIAITDHGSIRAEAIVLALGDGARTLSALADLPLHRVKGQTIRLARPPGLAADHPAVAGAGYVVPRPDGVLVGTTFEHDFADLAPDPSLDAGLAHRGAMLVPELVEAAVRDRRAGVRLTVPAVVSPRRLPLAGPLPGHPGVWVVTGLGAKGLLTAPLIARHLPAALNGESPLPGDLWPV